MWPDDDEPEWRVESWTDTLLAALCVVILLAAVFLIASADAGKEFGEFLKSMGLR